jgi:putative transcriptional regulator
VSVVLARTPAARDTTMTKVGNGKSLAPTLLLSMPQLCDPNFKQTVVLLCEHGADGAFGLVLNRQTDTPASSVVRLTPPVDRDNGLQLWIGGPVEPERGWILLGQEPDEAESVEVCEGLYLSTSPELLRRLLSDQPPRRTRLLTGYAGWDAGQLDEELSSSSWLIADVELDLIFDTQSTQMWETAIRRLGAEPSMLQMGRGVH